MTDVTMTIGGNVYPTEIGVLCLRVLRSCSVAESRGWLQAGWRGYVDDICQEVAVVVAESREVDGVYALCATTVRAKLREWCAPTHQLPHDATSTPDTEYREPCLVGSIAQDIVSGRYETAMREMRDGGDWLIRRVAQWSGIPAEALRAAVMAR